MPLLLALLLAAAPAAPASAAAPLTLAQARASMIGRWQGKLEYRDYQADRWFGLPMTVSIRDGGDGVTHIRTADFDDGPETGMVRITTVSMLLKDGASEASAAFRKNKDVALATDKLALTAATDPSHWTLVAEEAGTDDNRPARIRVTTVRAGDTMAALKEVDFTDDAATSWLTRNRTTLTRVGD